MSQRSCDRWLTVCGLFWLGPATKEVLEEGVRVLVCRL